MPLPAVLGGLALATMSGDAEAGLVQPKLDKFAQKLFELFKNRQIDRKQFYEEVGSIPTTDSSSDVVNIVSPGKFKELRDSNLIKRQYDGLPVAVKLDDVYDNPQLMGQYPTLKDLTVVLADKSKLTPNTHEPYQSLHRGKDPALGGLETIWLRSHPSYSGKLEDRWPMLSGKYNSLEHEIFHGIQNRGRMSTDYNKLSGNLPWHLRIDEILASLGAQQNLSPLKLIDQLDLVLGKGPRKVLKRESRLNTPHPEEAELIRNGFNQRGPEELKLYLD